MEKASYSPKLLPEAARPIAVAILVLKYVEMIATAGTNKQPAPIPMQIACDSITCQ